MRYNNVELFGFASSGKVKMWKASSDFSLNADNHIEIIVEWGYVDGKKQTKTRYVKAGKNKGKANETTIEKQAELDIGYLYQKQLDDGYVTQDALENLRENPIKSVMLATKFKDKQHLLKVDENGDFVEEVFIQPKLNGIRCKGLNTGQGIDFVSRTEKPFAKFNHLEVQILKTKLEQNKAFDHELFNTKLPFEIISSIVNSDDHLYSKDEIEYDESVIQMHIYDLLGYDTLTYKERLALLTELSKDFGPEMILVETVQVKNMTQLVAKMAEWIRLGYEGGMIRVGSGLYEYGKRSAKLIKYKIMEQAEAEILDIFLAPQDPTKVMFKLRTPNPINSDPQYATFECGIIGNKKDAYDKYYLNKKNYIGKYLTFDYQTLSLYGVPLFAVGQYIRAGWIDDKGTFIPEV